MDIKKLFCVDEESQEEGKKNRFPWASEKDETPTAKPKKKFLTYSEMLGLNKDFQFPLKKVQITDSRIFKSVVDDAMKTLKADLKRFGYEYEEVDLQNTRMGREAHGRIGSMTIIVGAECLPEVRFHFKEDVDAFWDNGSKKTFPERKTGEEHYKYTVMFTLEAEEDEE